jgi:hypothetical protein
MPKATGQPITISNGQPQREVERFQVFVSYDNDGTPRFTFQAFTMVRLRDGTGAIVHQEPGLSQLVSLADAQVPTPVRTAFTAILNKLDTLPDPT